MLYTNDTNREWKWSPCRTALNVSTFLAFLIVKGDCLIRVFDACIGVASTSWLGGPDNDKNKIKAD